MLYTETPDLSTSSIQPLDLQQLLGRICVRPPYFALRHPRLVQQTFEAEAVAELPQGAECGPMQGAELSRHAAIAGSCAAALLQEDDKRRYYLAQEAEYRGSYSDAPYGTPILLRAHCTELTKRQARAEVTAFVHGEVLTTLSVLYTILPDSAFERLFKTRLQPTPPARAMASLPLGTVERQGDSFVRVIDHVPAAACAGHFDGYPAMPVAMLMGQLSYLASHALGGASFYSPHTTVEAKDFCWAGEQARFQVRPTSRSGSHVAFACHAWADGREVGAMSLTVTLTDT